MESVKVGIAIRLFINGQQIGSDSTFMNYYENAEDAITDTREFYQAETYTIEGLESDLLPRWPGAESVPTVIVRVQKNYLTDCQR